MLGALGTAASVRAALGRLPQASLVEQELLGVQASHDLDHLQVLVDVSATGTSGYQAADWLRDHCSVDMGRSRAGGAGAAPAAAT